MTLEIREARRDDIPAVGELRKECLGANEYALYENNIGRPRLLNLVATDDARICGFITVLETVRDPGGAAMWQRVAPYVGFVGVRERDRRRGIATRLMQEAKRLLHERGAGDWLYLECNEDLIPLYTKEGFVQMDSDDAQGAFGLRPKAVFFRFPLRQLEARACAAT